MIRHALLAAILLSLPNAVHAASRPDAWLTMKAKTALYLAKDVTGTAINVDTINGHVTLHGTVRDAKEKARAVEVVNAIEGVGDVRDLLRVASRTQNATMMRRSDDLVRSDVQKRLKSARSLDDSSISVKSVDDGVVLLTGRAASFDDSQRALDYAAGQPGVVRVASEIDVPDALPDEDFRAEAETTPEPGRRDLGGVTSDLWITCATKTKLAADPRTPATEINVDSHDGSVTLFGRVRSRESKSAAAEIARGVSGVKRVENRLEVVSPGTPDSVQASDDDIQRNVAASLNDSDSQENAGIDVEVKNGVVRLTGTVSTWQRNLSAIYIARSVNGVRSVRSELQVETRNAARR